MGLARRGEVLWEPAPSARERTALARFERFVGERHGRDFAGDYHALWRWSVEQLEDFWAAVWDHFQVIAHRPYEQVLAERKMPGARWFPGAELNYAEHVFRAGEGRDAEPALHARSETRPARTVAWGELRELTARIRTGLVAAGVGRGDRVCAYLPNVPETVAAFLATASLGAIWSSAAPEFGVRAVLDRFRQIEPKVLLAIDGYRYGGRDFERMGAVRELAAAMPSLERTFVLPYLAERPSLDAVERAAPWSELVADRDELRFEPVPFDHPLWILYSSGTTGLPKAIVHGHGGILLEHLKKMHLHTDLAPGDRFFWFTTTGWMMWNFLVSGLLAGAELVLYDGSPGHPDMLALWRLADEIGITCFGTSAAFIHSCMKAGVEPGRELRLERLRSVGSTGSPLSPEGFVWTYERVKRDLWLFSTSGGTDVCTAFVGGVPTLPVWCGELQARALGAKVEAFDERGHSVIGQVGELVITEPMPSMPVFFWNDPDGSRYRESYFDVYPGVWRHGDWIEITPRGSAVIYGRSDATINRQGVRMGTSEIYRAVLAVDEVEDALVVDVPRSGGDSWMPLFVVLREGVELNDELKDRIRRRVREDCSPRHVPDEIFQVPAIPRTLSGKTLEVPIKRILMGTPPERAASRESLANPEAFDFFVELAGRLASSAAGR
ncbi:acetoacetate--CoA ligase [Thermoleophilum album]|uniref:Acetoacetyl-CoA synthetase n=1 Tax=Thermoleophilum album TaxID=29539 RepID=A0A1H6G0T0_THEAL|nr:acetoacetate--CoA ligase [Thermoleophilum album]SEH15505.1 acetoacetyl-CoA synthetase [Thermoleophilum album]